MWNIALNTFRELVRSRIFALVLVFAVALILFSLALAGLSMGQSTKIIVDFGLAMIELSWLVAVVFIGWQMLFKEAEGRTIYLILSKPIKRHSFLLGKFFGFALVLALIILAESAFFLGLVAFKGIAISALLFLALLAVYLKLATVFALVLFFSTFSSSILAILFTLAIYIASHSAQMVIDMAIRSKNGWFYHFGQGMVTILPNFEALAYPKTLLGTSVVHIEPLAYLATFGHALLYIVMILIFAIAAFSRKNFENA